jgi:hypothetical protein
LLLTRLLVSIHQNALKSILQPHDYTDISIKTAGIRLRNKPAHLAFGIKPRFDKTIFVKKMIGSVALKQQIKNRNESGFLCNSTFRVL